MHKPSINIIGCGRLSKTIAALLLDRQLVNLKGIVNSTYESAQHASRYLNNGTAYQYIYELPAADIYLITTKDNFVKEIAATLHSKKILPPNAIVIHCSGSLSSDELIITKKSKCYIASLHPIKSFADPEQAYQTFSGTYCAIEGDEQACIVLKDLFEKIGGIVFSIDKAHKKIYHAGSVIANNYLVTLHYYATQCYLKAGIEEETAKHIVSMLMKDGLDNLTKLSHQNALTGPIQRGDVNTIQQHLDTLNQASSLNIRDLYTTLGMNTLALTSHTDNTKKSLEEALKK